MPTHISPVDTYDPLYELTTIRDKLRELIELTPASTHHAKDTLIYAYNCLGDICTAKQLGEEEESWQRLSQIPNTSTIPNGHTTTTT